MAGGGTGGHVIPALAVARELKARGHEVFFVGTERGLESRLVPAAGFRLERIEIGGLKGVGVARRLTSLVQLPLATWRVRRFGRPSAVFSMGGYVAGPPVISALLRRIPLVVMEPNAVPGFTNRWIGRFVSRALISFTESAIYFPKSRTEVTGLPVREEFFRLPAKTPGPAFQVLITGGSQGSQTLNKAFRDSWPFFRDCGLPVRFLHQAGRSGAETLQRDFAGAGLDGTVTTFIDDMPAAFADADLVVCRAGAGAVAELAAAGKPSILVPFPFATDNHQLHNAQAFERGGATVLAEDRELTGARLFEIVRSLAGDPSRLKRMGEAARRFARPGAAARAAEILEEVSETAKIH